MLRDIVDLIQAVGGLLWPIVIASIFWYFREPLRRLLERIRAVDAEIMGQRLSLQGDAERSDPPRLASARGQVTSP